MKILLKGKEAPASVLTLVDSELPNYFSYSTVLEVMNQMFHRQSVHRVRQEHSHLMEHYAKLVLMEAIVLKGRQNVLSVHLDISKCA